MNGFGRAARAQRRFALPRDDTAPGQARRCVERLLRRHGAAEQVRGAAKLVASELVSNALRHGQGEVELRLGLTDHFLRIEVVDQGRDQAPAVRAEPADESGGWGLRIVDQLAAQWGVFEGTTHVWADVDLT